MRGKRPARLFLPALLGILAAARAGAQSLRDFEYSRASRGEQRLRAQVVFAAGKLRLTPGSRDQLYQLTMAYDAERFRPLGTYHPETGVVRLGTETNGEGVKVGWKRAPVQTAAVGFSREVELALDVTLGAAEAELELGGYRLTELELKSGASSASLSFSSPNPASCRSASVSSGAGEVTITQLGNSGCQVWEFNGGVGSVTLDLAGAWTVPGRIQLNVALGGVKLLAPRELGIRVQLNGFLAGFDAEGFSKSGKTYTSAGYASARRRVDVIVSSALGGVSVEWK